MYTLITMIKTAVLFGLRGGRIPSVGRKPEPERFPGQQTGLCVAGSADDVRKSACVWMELCVLHPPPLFCLLSTHSLSLSLSLPSDVLGDTFTHGTHKDGAGLSEWRDSDIIITDNYSTDSIVHKSGCCPCIGAYVRRRRCVRGGREWWWGLRDE